MKAFAKFALSSAVGEGQSGIGYGCMGITAFYGDSMADGKALELLKTVYDAGCRHFDTAELYATKEKSNEATLGEFFKTVPRDSYSVATKYWPENDKYDYDTVKRHLVASLKRLQLDHVDLYYAHRVSSLEGGIEFAKAAKRLKEEGLVKEIGLSEVSGAWLKQIHSEAPIDAVQQEWSILTRNLEDELVPVCKELDVAIVAYSPLARNLLANKVVEKPNDWRGDVIPRYQKDNIAKNQKIVDQVHDLAEKYNCTGAQLSLAWLFAKANQLGVTVVPIPGTTKPERAKSNIESVKIQIKDEDMVVLDAMADQVAGARGDESYTSSGIESQK